MVASIQTSQKILIVDDDLDTLKLVGTTLEKQGFIIIAAKDGAEALDKVAQQKPDLIILDIMMPQLDGYEVTRRLRSNPETADIPIILFTAKGQVEDKVAGLDVGANEYLTKPTHPAELIARVRNLLKRPTIPTQIPRTQAGPAQLATVIGVMAGKGGQGVSTLSVNLATGFQRRNPGAQVILLELRPGRGDIGIQIGYTNPQALSDLLKKKVQNIHHSVVENALVTHKSGLKMLLSSHDPMDATLMANGEQTTAIIQELARMASYLVLDLGVGLHPTTQHALQQCSKVVVVVEPDPHAMAHAHSLIDDLKKIGVSENKILAVVVHRVRTEQAMNAADVQRALGLEINAVFTPAPELAFRAIQMHQTMVTLEPDSYTAQQTLKLVDKIMEPVTA